MDHYKTLGVSPGASKAEIKAAFRRSALDFHPDRHSQSPAAARDLAALRFKLASEAYQVLIDDLKRAAYDRSRSSWSSSSSSSYSYYYNNSYGYGYGGGGAGGGYYRRPPPPREGAFDFGILFRYFTRRGFLVSVACAGAMLGGAVAIERCAEAMWKVNNSGKSFEDAIESIEKVKVQKRNS